MAAPIPRLNGLPAGFKMPDGYRTLVTCFLNRNLSFWETEVTPLGYDAGDAIDTTTMRNNRWRTMDARSLVTTTDVSLTAGWDTKLYPDLINVLGFETTWTILFRDLSNITFYGFLKKFDPQSLKEGDFPLVQMTITPTNTDPVTGAEEQPVWADVPPVI